MTLTCENENERKKCTIVFIGRTLITMGVFHISDLSNPDKIIPFSLDFPYLFFLDKQRQLPRSPLQRKGSYSRCFTNKHNTSLSNCNKL